MKVLVVYHSVYGHILKMAQTVEEGVKSVNGVEAVFRRVQDWEDAEKGIFTNDYAKKVWQQQKDTPICTLEDLKEADGIIFGTPTRYGNMTAQMKRLIDSTVKLWLAGDMEGKPAGVFTSTSTTHGGQETTLLTMMVPLIHLGMIIIGVPYSTPGLLHTEGRGGTPYGPSTLAGSKNELLPTPEDLSIATAFGKKVAEITKKLRKDIII